MHYNIVSIPKYTSQYGIHAQVCITIWYYYYKLCSQIEVPEHRNCKLDNITIWYPCPSTHYNMVSMPKYTLQYGIHTQVYITIWYPCPSMHYNMVSMPKYALQYGIQYPSKLCFQIEVPEHSNCRLVPY